MKQDSVSIINKVEQLSIIAEKVEMLGSEWDLPQATVFNLNLVLEELFTNVVFYGYNDEEEHTIDIQFYFENEKIFIKITNDSDEFNPLETVSPDLDKSLEEREVGGLGIFLVKELTESISYERVNDKNIYSIVMKVS